MLIREFLNKYPDIVQEELPPIILGVNYDLFMAKNFKDTKHTRHISRIEYVVRNGEK